VDLVLDCLNGSDADKGFQLLKPFGKIIHFGMSVISFVHVTVITW